MISVEILEQGPGESDLVALLDEIEKALHRALAIGPDALGVEAIAVAAGSGGHGHERR